MNRPIYTTPEDAEHAFYDALARNDLEAMMTVWAEDEDVVCVHPNGPRLTGYAAIRDAWRQMFANGPRLKVRISQVVRSQAMLMAVHNVFEQVTLEHENHLPPPIIATNVYLRGAHGWQMIMHHASPSPDAESFAPGPDAPRVVH